MISRVERDRGSALLEEEEKDREKDKNEEKKKKTDRHADIQIKGNIQLP